MAIRRTFEDAVLFDPLRGGWQRLNNFTHSNGLFTSVSAEHALLMPSHSGELLFAIPGLIDAHLHIAEEPMRGRQVELSPGEPIETTAARVKRNLECAGRVGVTTVRDFGSYGYKSLYVREWMRREGLLDGLPRLITTGGFLTRVGGHAVERGIVIGPDANPIKVVRTLADMGADGIKIMKSDLSEKFQCPVIIM